METKSMEQLIKKFVNNKIENDFNFLLRYLAIMLTNKNKQIVEVCDIRTKYGFSRLMDNTETLDTAIAVYKDMKQLQPIVIIYDKTKEKYFFSVAKAKNLLKPYLEELCIMATENVEKFKPFWKEFYQTEIL